MEKKNKRNRFPCTKVRSVTHNINFDSVQDAADYYDLDQSHVSKVCRGKRNHSGGIVFEYIKDFKK